MRMEEIYIQAKNRLEVYWVWKFIWISHNGHNKQ